MIVLFSVPEVRSSGGWRGIRMEVPAQHSGAVAQLEEQELPRAEQRMSLS